jgi:pantoate--beta-alanine ligase
MRIEDSLEGLRGALAGAVRVGFVPTMGNLHAGHLALVREARRLVGPEGTVVASIFVNRLQFGPNEDFDKYPRTFERDAALLRETGCDLLFAPDETVMYPEPQAFHVVPDPALASTLEGAVRPGHFDGVMHRSDEAVRDGQPELAVFDRRTTSS